MRKVILAIASILFAATTVLARDPVRRPMTTDDALNMVLIKNVLMSPDGRQVFFSKSELDWEENKRSEKHYMISTDGEEAIQFIGDAGGSEFQFSPDGKHLSFLRDVDGNEQIFWMRISGGEAVKLTDHTNSIISYEWSADASKIFFTA
ncbi:MAG: hypothetical protein V3U86_07680, partial [Acidobacteriota bacterium]